MNKNALHALMLCRLLLLSAYENPLYPTLHGRGTDLHHLPLVVFRANAVKKNQKTLEKIMVGVDGMSGFQVSEN